MYMYTHTHTQSQERRENCWLSLTDHRQCYRHTSTESAWLERWGILATLLQGFMVYAEGMTAVLPFLCLLGLVWLVLGLITVSLQEGWQEGGEIYREKRRCTESKQTGQQWTRVRKVCRNCLWTVFLSPADTLRINQNQVIWKYLLNVKHKPALVGADCWILFLQWLVKFWIPWDWQPVEIMSSFLYYLLPAVGGYAVASIYLLKNPHILHKKKQTAFHCRHISHRGGKVSISPCQCTAVCKSLILDLDN